MATTTPAPMSVSEGMESARAALSSALSGAPVAPSAPPATTTAPAPAPVSQPAPTPAPAVVTPPSETAPASEPVTYTNLPPGLSPPPSSQPAPTEGIPPSPVATPAPLSITDPAAARYLEMNGGNAEAALAKALRDNNRLAELAKAHPELFKPGGPADPSRTLPPDTTLFVDPSQPQAPELGDPTSPTPPTGPEIPMNWEQITTEVDRSVLGDDVCKALIREWTENDKIIRENKATEEAGVQRLSYLSALLKDADTLGLPELRVEEFRDEFRTLRQDIAAAKQDALLRTLQNDRLDQRFRGRRTEIHDHVASSYKRQASEQAEQAQLKQLEDGEYQRLSSTWPGAVQRAIAGAQIPAELAADFEKYAKQSASASLNDPSFRLDDVEKFLTTVAQGYVSRLDQYHRAKAAQYGNLAAARAASPSPVAQIPGTPAPPPAPNRMMTPEEAMNAAAESLRARVRG